ncbi:hypothetical protein CKAN_02412200 [Cinnamomum micranthum f. kanehirae]|uniref:Chromo domain-containing protein n=1 Tax=Cinnamomum micranthum f. kanehirae TaxID=337451 RepID=A0A443PVN2_9MAGN|nr:hypothetical protein CKAN_02412200 [Cinnamomum micranthum f. kanehirae]
MMVILLWNLRQFWTLDWSKKSSNFVEEILVKWKRLPVEDATWENAQELRDKFINMNLEDKVPLNEGGNDKLRRSNRVSLRNPRSAAFEAHRTTDRDRSLSCEMR